MKKKVFLFILIIVLLYAGGGVTYILLNKKPKPVEVSDLDKISGYNYTLKSNATELYKNEFNKLKQNLESATIDDKEYALSVAKLFIIDLYTLDNKTNKYDVGGSMFVHPDYVANYKLNVQDTLYKYLEDNSSKQRNQKLPEVSSIEVTLSEEIMFKVNEEEYPAYNILLEWDYKEDLGYDKEGEVDVVKVDKYYYVVEKN